MKDDERSPVQHHLVLHRIDPEQGIRRFYSLMIERDLFGTVRLVRNWSRIGTNGQELVEVFASKDEARHDELASSYRRSSSLRNPHVALKTSPSTRTRRGRSGMMAAIVRKLACIKTCP